MPATWKYRGEVLLVVAEGLDTPDEWQQALQEAMADPASTVGFACGWG